MATLSIYDRPAGEPIVLPLAPRLASWMAAGHPDQARLQRYLDATERAVAQRLAQLSDPLALSLTVGRPPTTSLLNEHDLDNFLYPLVHRLAKGGRKIVAVWGTKHIAERSELAIATAARDTAAEAAALHEITVSASSQSVAFKEQVRDGVADLDELPTGPVALTLAYAVGPTRNWINLWKPTIDSLGPLLGEPGRKWNPLDGRIVDLALHCTTDPAAGNTVLIGLRADLVVVDRRRSDRVQVPDGTDQLAALEFALTYNAYEVHGTAATATIAEAVRRRWEQDGTLPNDVDELRTALFFEQRRRHDPYDPEPFNRLPLVSTILDRLRLMAPDGLDRVGHPL